MSLPFSLPSPYEPLPATCAPDLAPSILEWASGGALPGESYDGTGFYETPFVEPAWDRSFQDADLVGWGGEPLPTFGPTPDLHSPFPEDRAAYWDAFRAATGVAPLGGGPSDGPIQWNVDPWPYSETTFEPL